MREIGGREGTGGREGMGYEWKRGRCKQRKKRVEEELRK